MSPLPIILHHDEGTAGSARLTKIMALKGLAWGSCALTNWAATDGPLSAILAGAIGHPILQKGSTFWVSSLAAIEALEELFPEPTLFPNGNRGMPLALSWWSDDLSEQATVEQVAAHVTLITRQLADGRDFLQGPAPGLADAQAYAGLSVAWRNLEPSALPAEKGQPVKGWFERVTSLGEGRRHEISAQEARKEASSGKRIASEAQLVAVSVFGGDSGFTIEGRDMSSSGDQISIAITEPDGAFAVHFPAIGYQATPV